jgi:hypothetical protein
MQEGSRFNLAEKIFPASGFFLSGERCRRKKVRHAQLKL